MQFLIILIILGGLFAGRGTRKGCYYRADEMLQLSTRYVSVELDKQFHRGICEMSSEPQMFNVMKKITIVFMG